MSQWKIGDRFYYVSPARDGHNILFVIEKFLDENDEEVKNGKNKIGDVKYKRADGQYGGGVVPASEANYLFRKAGLGNGKLM